MNSSIAELNALLFENTDKIPEGLYLQLMNLSAKVYKEQSGKEKTKVERTIVRYDTPMYTLDSMDTGYYLYTQRRMVALQNKGGSFITNCLPEGGIFQVYTEGFNLEFYEVSKINENSVHFIKWFAQFDILENKYVWYDSKIQLKSRGLSNKNIIIYDKNQDEVKKLFNDTILKTYEEHPRHNDYTGNNMPRIQA